MWLFKFIGSDVFRLPSHFKIGRLTDSQFHRFADLSLCSFNRLAESHTKPTYIHVYIVILLSRQRQYEILQICTLSSTNFKNCETANPDI